MLLLLQPTPPLSPRPTLLSPPTLLPMQWPLRLLTLLPVRPLLRPMQRRLLLAQSATALTRSRPLPTR
jgi:hypothetical protein